MPVKRAKRRRMSWSRKGKPQRSRVPLGSDLHRVNFKKTHGAIGYSHSQQSIKDGYVQVGDERVKVDKQQKIYWIDHGKYFDSLGFDHVIDTGKRIAEELKLDSHFPPKGTIEAYRKYSSIIEAAREENERTGWRSEAELTPQLNGLEGKRVKVTDAYGETRRFWVGKSTGFIPIHLELSRTDSSGGGAVTGAPFKKIEVIAEKCPHCGQGMGVD